MQLASGARSVAVRDRDRGQLFHPLDARYVRVSIADLNSVMRDLCSRVDAASIDCVLGFPEGGTPAAFSAAQILARPLVLSSLKPHQLPNEIQFEEPHASLSAPMLGAGLAEAIRGSDRDLRIVIKPHPVIPGWRPEWMRAWRAAAARDPNVELVEDADADIVPFLLAADVLVTDASSVALSFLALDRPIVWVTSPRAKADPAYEPEDLLWARRDIGDEVTALAELPRAVVEALHDPAHRGPQRREVAATLFEGWDDGSSTQRVVDRLSEMAALPNGQRPQVERSLAQPPEPAWRVHDLRVTVRNHGALRRLALGRLENVRLRERERAMERATRQEAASPNDEAVQ